MFISKCVYLKMPKSFPGSICDVLEIDSNTDIFLGGA